MRACPEAAISYPLPLACVPRRRDVLNWLVTDQLPRQNATLFLGDLGLQYEAGLKAHVARIRGLFPALPQLIMHTSVPLSHMRQLQVTLRVFPMGGPSSGDACIRNAGCRSCACLPRLAQDNRGWRMSHVFLHSIHGGHLISLRSHLLKSGGVFAPSVFAMASHVFAHWPAAILVWLQLGKDLCHVAVVGMQQWHRHQRWPCARMTCPSPPLHELCLLCA
jgi:hypothetical protein